MKRQAGRPQKFSNDFYLQMLNEHENFSISQMSEIHKVSLSTIKNWIRRGKEIQDEKENSNKR